MIRLSLSIHKLIICASLLSLIGVFAMGCAGDCLCTVYLPGQGSVNGFLFSTEELQCKSTTLYITKVGTTFTTGNVTFTNKANGMQYDGSGPVTSQGIASGFPPNAPAGTYGVTVNGEDAGTVTYGAGNC